MVVVNVEKQSHDAWCHWNTKGVIEEKVELEKLREALRGFKVRVSADTSATATALGGRVYMLARSFTMSTRLQAATGVLPGRVDKLKRRFSNAEVGEDAVQEQMESNYWNCIQTDSDRIKPSREAHKPNILYDISSLWTAQTRNSCSIWAMITECLDSMRCSFSDSR